MPRTQGLHRSDLLEALGIEIHELRPWLELEPLASRPTKARSATRYSPVDLLFLTVIQRLDEAGLKVQAMQPFSKGLFGLLQQPAGKDDVFVIHRDGDHWKLGPAPAGGEAMEFKVPLVPARRQVLEYTGAPTISGQREMGLLTPIRVGTRSRRA